MNIIKDSKLSAIKTILSGVMRKDKGTYWLSCSLAAIQFFFARKTRGVHLFFDALQLS